MNHRMSILAFLLVAQFTGAACAAEPALRTQTLCGWFQNPTPGNVWLQDRNAEWVIGIQGGHQAEGDWPEFTASEWVNTNRSYGYGCACIKGIVNNETHEVVSIVSARAQSLSVCRRDRALKQPVD